MTVTHLMVFGRDVIRTRRGGHDSALQQRRRRQMLLCALGGSCHLVHVVQLRRLCFLHLGSFLVHLDKLGLG